MQQRLLQLHQELAGSTLSEQAAELLREHYRQILRQADEEEPPPKVKQSKGRPKNTPGRDLLRCLQQHEDAVLAFALVEGIPFTNNLAERDLRPVKVKQKVSGGFRTVLGAEVYALLQAIISPTENKAELSLPLCGAFFPTSLLRSWQRSQLQIKRKQPKAGFMPSNFKQLGTITTSARSYPSEFRCNRPVTILVKET